MVTSPIDIILLFLTSVRGLNCFDIACTGVGSLVKYVIDVLEVLTQASIGLGYVVRLQDENMTTAAYPELIAVAACYSGVAVGCLKGSSGSSLRQRGPDLHQRGCQPHT